MKKSMTDFFRFWDFHLLGIFLLIRIILNAGLDSLSIFFFVSYLILFLMLVSKTRFFIRLFVLFLILDNMIATYVASRPELGMMSGFGFDFYSVVIINFIFIIIALNNKTKRLAL